MVRNDPRKRVVLCTMARFNQMVRNDPRHGEGSGRKGGSAPETNSGLGRFVSTPAKQTLASRRRGGGWKTNSSLRKFVFTPRKNLASGSGVLARLTAVKQTQVSVSGVWVGRARGKLTSFWAGLFLMVIPCCRKDALQRVCFQGIGAENKLHGVC